MKKRIEKISTFLLLFCTLLLAGDIILRSRTESRSAAPEKTEDVRRTPVVKAIEKVLPSVVNLSSRRLFLVRNPFSMLFDEPDIISRNSLGSGIIIDDRGYVLTNAHVVHNAVDISITFSDGTVRKAVVAADDIANDVALLKFDPGNRKLKVISLAEPGDLMLGETTVAVGNPYGLDTSITSGLVSGLNRSLSRNGTVLFRDLIQTDTPVFPGSSGGPLVNLEGKMIGMNSGMKEAGIGFAIPLLRIENALSPFLIPERSGNTSIGILPEMLADGKIRVRHVLEGSPAFRAGIRSGAILKSMDSWDPSGKLLELCRRLGRVRPGEKVVLDLNGGTRAVLKAVPLDSSDGITLAKEHLGLGLMEASPSLKRELNLPDFPGLIITSPPEGSSLRRGELLAALNGKFVASSEDLVKALLPLRTGTVSAVVLSGEDGKLFKRTVSLRIR